MASTSITLKGWKQYSDKLKAAPKKVIKEMNAQAAISANNIANGARNRSPFDDGRLRGSIHATELKPGQWSVTVGVNYAAYMEFGTKSRVQIPSGLGAYAAQFKGKGMGDYFDFLASILAWVKRKGIVAYGAHYSVKTHRRMGNKAANRDADLEAAQMIANAIMRHGVRAHPFLFPSVEEERPKFYNRLKQAINNI